jgi:hypothetical protein
MIGEIKIQLEPLLGVKQTRRVHVVAFRSPLYDVILGSDLMDWAGCSMKVQGGQWKVKLGKRLFVCKEALPPKEHVVVSALRVATYVQTVKGQVKRELEKVLAREDELLPATGRVEHTIVLTDERPVWVPHRRYPHAQLDVIRKELKKLLDGGIIQPSKSPYNSPLWVVPKSPGPDGQPRYRVVVDYRALNKKTNNGEGFW